MKASNTQRKIEILAEPLPPVSPHIATDNHGQQQEIFLVREQPLTIYLNRVEVVTLMTMGATPADLIAGFLLNQQLIEKAQDIDSIHVDWGVNAAAVYAKQANPMREKTEKRIITSGCGQGTMFASVMQQATQKRHDLPHVEPPDSKQIRNLLTQLSRQNTVYKQAGGVHSCALCTTEGVIKMIEDVGRHNAVDSLAGFMALSPPKEKPQLLYTTGRLTSEMVIKTAQMGLPMVISRSSATSMGVAVAKTANITLIARARGQRYLVL